MDFQFPRWINSMKTSRKAKDKKPKSQKSGTKQFGTEHEKSRKTGIFKDKETGNTYVWDNGKIVGAQG